MSQLEVYIVGFSVVQRWSRFVTILLVFLISEER